MTKETPSLFVKLSRFPRLGLAHLPTPLDPMKRLTAHLGGPRLWVKREDATGLGFGGNKLRKLDYVLHEAIASGADTLVSGGVVQSNSQRQVAAAAAPASVVRNVLRCMPWLLVLVGMCLKPLAAFGLKTV